MFFLGQNSSCRRKYRFTTRTVVNYPAIPDPTMTYFTFSGRFRRFSDCKGKGEDIWILIKTGALFILGRLAFTRAKKDLLVTTLFRISSAIHYEATSVVVKRGEREGECEDRRKYTLT
jgi:hypothetical protein